MDGFEKLATSIKAKLEEFKASLISTDEELARIISLIPKDCVTACDTETDGLDTKSANIVGFSFSYDDKEGF